MAWLVYPTGSSRDDCDINNSAFHSRRQRKEQSVRFDMSAHVFVYMCSNE